MLFNRRQLTQIRAALIFWQSVAGTSKVHPLVHPKVKKFYAMDAGAEPPLTSSEIEALVSNPLAWVTETEDNLAPILSVASSPAARIRVKRQLRRMGLRPVDKLGRLCRYRVHDLYAAKAALADQDAAATAARRRKARLCGLRKDELDESQ